MVRLAIVTTVLCVALAAATPATQAAGAIVVPCGDIVDRVATGTLGGYRVVLGTFSVPAPLIPQTEPLRTGRWRFWSKAGLVVKAGGGAPVSVAVPPAWRRRIAIGWGNSVGSASVVRFARCGAAGQKRWNAYAGGFLLRARSECFPLEFAVGGETAVRWFGVGRRCPNRLTHGSR